MIAAPQIQTGPRAGNLNKRDSNTEQASLAMVKVVLIGLETRDEILQKSSENSDIEFKNFQTDSILKFLKCQEATLLIM